MMTKAPLSFLLATVPLVFGGADATAQNFPGITYSPPQQVAPGVKYFHGSDSSVPWEIDVTEIDLSLFSVELQSVSALSGCETVSSMAQRSRGVAAINAGYFDSNCNSVSHLEIDGKLAATNAGWRPARTTFGLWGNHDALMVQDRVDSTNTASDPDWAYVIDAIGGGPNLLTAGLINNTCVEEEFDASINCNGREPRTFLGWNPTTNLVLLVTVDGRQTGWSVGMTMNEGAMLLQDLGATEGMNYDGGGSSAHVINGSVVNKPSDGSERSVVSAWVAIPSFITDNTDAEFASTPSWSASANAGYYNTNSLVRAGGTGSETVTFGTDLSQSGEYEVFAWWVSASNRATAAPVTVNHALGSTSLSLDQTVNGSQWNSLGTWVFKAGNEGNVHITDAVPSTQYVSADAVKYVLVKEYNKANLDSMAVGSISAGSFHTTHFQDGYSEALTEAAGSGGPVSNRKSTLDHVWTFSVVAGSTQVLNLDAHHTPNSEGDNFVFSYSKDNSNWTSMVTVTKTSGDNIYQTYTFPEDVSGTLYIRVQDTDATGGNNAADTVYVDHLFIDVSGTSVGDTVAPAAPTLLAATAGDATVSLDWADSTETDLAGYDVYRSTSSGSSYMQINGSLLATSGYTDSSVSNGTTYYYVVTATDTSSNESSYSNEASATPTSSGSSTASTLSVSNIVPEAVGAGGGSKKGQATVTMVNNLGATVSGAGVTGTFSGSYSETVFATTDSTGNAILTTTSTAKGGVSFTFCVDDVTDSALIYDSLANVETCDTY